MLHPQKNHARGYLLLSLLVSCIMEPTIKIFMYRFLDRQKQYGKQTQTQTHIKHPK
jgi:hypothetical protein